MTHNRGYSDPPLAEVVGQGAAAGQGAATGEEVAMADTGHLHRNPRRSSEWQAALVALAAVLAYIS